MSPEPSPLPADWPLGIGRHLLAEVDTTNAEAARRVAVGAGPAWIVAGFQTAGRGRRGRAWISPRGNFHGTLLLPITGGPALAALRSFVAALALHEALVALIGTGAGVQLKWPNDLLLDGGKVSGILLESLGPHHGRDWLAVGIGVNLIAAPPPEQVEPHAVRPVSVLATTGVRIEPAALLDRLAPAFAAWEERLTTAGFGPVRAAWLKHAARLGQVIHARAGTTVYEGVFAGIDDSGALLLETAQGMRLLPSADVQF